MACMHSAHCGVRGYHDDIGRQLSLNEAKQSILAGDKDYCLHCKGLVLTPLLQEYESKAGKPYTPSKGDS